MSHSQAGMLNRRAFLTSSSLILVGGSLCEAATYVQEPTPKGPDLPEELSQAEQEIVNNSEMGQDVANLFGKGYSCAETALAVGVHFLKKPEDLIWLAGGFGGGLNHGDLCGFLTGSIMTIGLSAGTLQMERKAAREICAQRVKDFWKWWVSTAPLHCAEIREGRKDLKVCHRIGRLAAVKVEGLIKPV
jgi:hypothetical protein